MFYTLNARAQDVFWVYLKDKNCETKSPNDYFSERAIQRRQRINIRWDSRDMPVCGDYVQALNQIQNIRVRQTSRWMNAVSVELTGHLAGMITQIQALPFVQKIEPIKIYSSPALVNENNDLTLREQIEYGQTYSQNKMIEIPALHHLGFTGRGMLIGVFDAGFSGVDTVSCFSHIYDENRLVYTENMVNPSEDVYRYSSHGTCVLSLMAGKKEGVFVGTAPDASYALFVTEDVSQEARIEEDHWLRAMEIADSIGVDVINSSLGYSTFDDTLANYTYQNMDGNTTLITRAADIAASRGILVVTSAGNEGSKPWKYITAPADADSVLTVGSVDPNKTYSSFSSVGPTYDGRLKPNVVAQGRNPFVVNPNGQITNVGSGTSFSGPIIAGAAACLWQSAPNYSHMDMIKAIETNASQSTFPENQLGFGIPNFLQSYYYLHPEDSFPLFNLQIDLFPNPMRNELYMQVYSPEQQAVMLSISDVLGQEILPQTSVVFYQGFQKMTINQIDWNNLKPGTYFFKISGVTNERTLRVVKQ